jgi:beta-lactamase regulating signal transducer with metallopeptidase domain
VPAASVLAPAIPIAVSIAPAIGESQAILETTRARPLSLAPRQTGGPVARIPARPIVVSPATVVMVIWAAGVAVCLLPILVGLCQVSGLRRSAVPWRRGQIAAATLILDGRRRRGVDVMVHEDVPGPMTCGVVRPAIILPSDAALWPLADLERAVVHELEHVRRRDWRTQCLARPCA